MEHNKLVVCKNLQDNNFQHWKEDKPDEYAIWKSIQKKNKSILPIPKYTRFVVQPLNEPSGVLFYLDYVYKGP